jgi:hypothetical protein
MLDNETLDEQTVHALLEFAADNPRSRWERWITYREVCTRTGRSVFWLMRPRHEDHAITRVALVSGRIIEAEERHSLFNKILDLHPDQDDVLVYVAS